ncbi:DCTN2 [Cordylochernes scorpioides]|uniref:DCTN2 n=1 Tax=Cordylochernes scorpioides TaxID=51811 RepID=A0ABY6L2V2_9ARAC|nr:DCTN2 [Cordylochernes scorpioides]
MVECNVGPAPKADHSDSIEKITLAPSEAYERFKDQSLINKDIDFTDSIASKRKTGYEFKAKDYETVSADFSKGVESQGQISNLWPYHVENTSYHPITEVKQCRSQSVLGRVTTWEHQV